MSAIALHACVHVICGPVCLCVCVPFRPCHVGFLCALCCVSECLQILKKLLCSLYSSSPCVPKILHTESMREAMAVASAGGRQMMALQYCICRCLFGTPGTYFVVCDYSRLNTNERHVCNVCACSLTYEWGLQAVSVCEAPCGCEMWVPELHLFTPCRSGCVCVCVLVHRLHSLECTRRKQAMFSCGNQLYGIRHWQTWIFVVITGKNWTCSAPVMLWHECLQRWSCIRGEFEPDWSYRKAIVSLYGAKLHAAQGRRRAPKRFYWRRERSLHLSFIQMHSYIRCVQAQIH